MHTFYTGINSIRISSFSQSLLVFRHVITVSTKYVEGLSSKDDNRGENAGKNGRFVHTRATTDRENRSVFSNPGFDSHINSPSVHNSFTVTAGPAVDSECKTSANRSNQQAAMFA